MEEIQENIAIDFQTFLSRGKELGWFNDEGLYPFKLKNIYDGIIDQGSRLKTEEIIKEVRI